MPIVQCNQCGKDVFKKASAIRTKNLFCDRKCQGLFRQKDNEIIIKENYTEILINSLKYGVKTCLIDTEDIDKINHIKWCLTKPLPTISHYAQGLEKNNWANRKNFRMHCLIMDCPSNFQIDHINHNTLDNRKENLRIVTYKQNNENRTKCNLNNKSSGIMGVYWHFKNKKWLAIINHNKKNN